MLTIEIIRPPALELELTRPPTPEIEFMGVTVAHTAYAETTNALQVLYNSLSAELKLQIGAVEEAKQILNRYGVSYG